MPADAAHRPASSLHPISAVLDALHPATCMQCLYTHMHCTRPSECLNPPRCKRRHCRQSLKTRVPADAAHPPAARPAAQGDGGGGRCAEHLRLQGRLRWGSAGLPGPVQPPPHSAHSQHQLPVCLQLWTQTLGSHIRFGRMTMISGVCWGIAGLPAPVQPPPDPAYLGHHLPVRLHLWPQALYIYHGGTILTSPGMCWGPAGRLGPVQPPQVTKLLGHRLQARMEAFTMHSGFRVYLGWALLDFYPHLLHFPSRVLVTFVRLRPPSALPSSACKTWPDQDQAGHLISLAGWNWCTSCRVHSGEP